MTDQPTIPFDKWHSELLSYARSAYCDCLGIIRYAERMDPEAWRDYYDEGYTPANALNEELSYD